MGALFFGSGILYAARNILPVCSAEIARELKWTRQDEVCANHYNCLIPNSQIFTTLLFFKGLVMGIFFWGYMLTQFAGGYLSDMLGGEIVLPSSSLVWGCITASFVLLPMASSQRDVVLESFLLFRFVLGIFQGKSS